MTCIFREIFRFPCPACGVTRALMSLIKCDFQKYCFYNIMAFPLLLAAILMFIGTKKEKKTFIFISITILIINILYYFIRLKAGTIP